MEIEIRKERESDWYETEAMTRRAFFNKFVPGCNEHLLVHKLRSHPAYLPEFSRVAVADGHVVGTILYFLSKVQAGNREIPVPSFGPLCADHRYKNHGIGAKLLESTLPLVKAAGYPGVIIVGEPDYYPKHGFIRAGSLGLTDGDGNVYDPFMALEFTPGALAIPGGRFLEPEGLCELPEAELAEFDRQFPYLMPAIRPCQWTYDNASQEKDGYRLEYAVKYLREFDRLFAGYLEELSRFDPGLKNTPPEAFTTEIRENVTDASYVILVEDSFAGLLVTSVPGEPVEDGDCGAYIQALYVSPEYRGRGIATDIALRFIGSQTRDTGLCMVENSPAGNFWKHLLAKADYRYDLHREDGTRAFWHIHREK